MNEFDWHAGSHNVIWCLVGWLPTDQTTDLTKVSSSFFKIIFAYRILVVIPVLHCSLVC